MAHVRIFTRLNINGKYFCIWLDFQLSSFQSFHEMMKLLSRSVKTDANFSVISYWDNKQESQAQSDRCKISDGVPISSIHPSIWNLVKQKWCKFRGLWLHSMNVVICLNVLSCCWDFAWAILRFCWSYAEILLRQKLKLAKKD